MNIRVAPTMDEANDLFLKTTSKKQDKTYSETLDKILTEVRETGSYLCEHLYNEKGRLILDSKITSGIEARKQNGD